MWHRSIGALMVAVVGLTILRGPTPPNAVIHAGPADPAGLADPGPHGAGWRRVTVARPDASTFTALLFYPADGSGENAPNDAAGAPYPAIAFGHGFAQTPDRYQGTLEHLATWGYFVIATESFSGILPAPDHARFAEDLRQSLTYLATESDTDGSWLAGQVDTAHFGLSGHSMGGGASILAAAADVRIKAVANLAAAETNPSAVAAMARVTAPISLIAGSADRIVPADSTHQLYDAGQAPRLFPVIQGGYHCGFQDTPFPIGCDSGPLAREDQLAFTRRMLTAFFNLYLKGDQTVWRWVWGPEALEDDALRTAHDPGFTLVIPIPLDAAAGASRADAPMQTQPMGVHNTGPRSDAYTLEVVDNSWPVELSVVTTRQLRPGQEEWLTITFEKPPGAEATFDTALVSARSSFDGLTRAYVEVNSNPATFGQIYLPLSRSR